jgi:hypothetical protein
MDCDGPAPDRTVPVGPTGRGAAPPFAHPPPRRVYVGRRLADGAGPALRVEYALGARAFVGRTTMDPELALVMARAALVGEGDVVLDPFAGTGGCLLAATHLSRTAGIAADLDARVLLAGGGVAVDGLAPRGARARRRGSAGGGDGDGGGSVAQNFVERGLPPPMLIVSDVGRLDARLDSVARDSDRRVQFDAIVTDPPYGQREARAWHARACACERHRPRGSVMGGRTARVSATCMLLPFAATEPRDGRRWRRQLAARAAGARASAAARRLSARLLRASAQRPRRRCGPRAPRNRPGGLQDGRVL